MTTSIVRLDAATGRVPLLGAAATRRVESALAATLPAHTLMQRAGHAVARLALAIAPHAREILVVAGPGNNGGDGFEAAAVLHAMGKDVRVVAVGSGVSSSPPADAAASRLRATTSGVAVLDAWPDDVDRVDLVVDALLGIGASRPPAGAIADAIARIDGVRRRGCAVLAVDVPSGLDVDRGAPIGDAASTVVATHTLTLLAAKPGLYTNRGRDHAGTVWLADIGAPRVGVAREADAWLVGRAGIEPPAARLHASHKGTHGDVVVVGGVDGMVGAAVLAARAALAAGAGRVIVDRLLGHRRRPDADAATAPAVSGFDPGWPELMWRSTDDDAVAAMQRATVVAGCGGGAAVAAALPRLLSRAPRLVLDADALNAIAADPALADALVARRRRGQATVLTPHPLEAARLRGADVAAIQSDRLAAARALANRYACVVVLKGSGTVIAAPDAGPPRIVATGTPALATGGTGDVLAGWLGGRWSATSATPDAGATAFELATTATVEHGWAADASRAADGLRAAVLVERLASLTRFDADETP